MIATLEKEVKDVVVVVESEERLVVENKTVLRGAADAMEGKINNIDMDSVYGKILDDMCP